MNRPFIAVLFAAIHLGSPTLACAQETSHLPRQDQQQVAVTAYAPKAESCRGMVIVSPGAGGSEAGYRYLGEALSALSYLAVVVGHKESGRDALREHTRHSGLREGLAELITEPDAYRGRFMDITAAKNWAQGRCKGSVAILIGHSMGAATALMEAGARNRLGIQGTDTFHAYIALSPQGPGSIFPENAWSGIRKPVLLMTGTRDNELGGASWQTRTEPFTNLPPGCKWLGVIDGASHMNFGGNGLSRKTEALTARTVGAFLDGVHTGECRPMHRTPGMDLTTK